MISWPGALQLPLPSWLSFSSLQIRAALQDHPLLPGFLDRNAAGWKALGRQWRQGITNWGVHIAAPSRSVADLIRLLDPGWSDIEIDIIPHGLPDFLFSYFLASTY